MRECGSEASIRGNITPNCAQFENDPNFLNRIISMDEALVHFHFSTKKQQNHRCTRGLEINKISLSKICCKRYCFSVLGYSWCHLNGLREQGKIYNWRASALLGKLREKKFYFCKIMNQHRNCKLS